MLDTILRTKLFIPPARPNLVARPQLIAVLDEGLRLGRKLSLISAPAGFGKTTLVSTWLAGSRRSVAWLALDEGDSDLTRFLTYFIAALQTVKEDTGERVLDVLQSSQPPSSELIATLLLNEMTAFPKNFVLVLDDYHLVNGQAVDQTLAFLLEHLPPQMHLVIATREDPNIPLARFRVRNEMSELRVRDLRFSAAEAAQFLNQVMGLKLATDEIEVLEKRTEGWIAGLQLAALSMRGRSDVAGFIEAFAGDNHYIVDYLAEEVLQRQHDDVRSFLLQTSILERLSGPLCGAVTGQVDSGEMLQTLERGNLFLIALDDRRCWYRYHHLFADVLQARLVEEQAEWVADLHRRASAWYEQNHFPGAAIHHALAAKDFNKAADLVELAWPAMDRSYQTGAWLVWAKALPDEMVRARPVLSVGYAWALLESGEMGASEERLRDAEQWLDVLGDSDERPEALPSEMVVVEEAQFQYLAASIATARAYRALAFGDIAGTVTYAQRALELLPEGDHQWRRAATSLLGLATYASGDLESAEQFLADLVVNMQQSGNIIDAIGIIFLLADIRVTLGRLGDVQRTYQHGLQMAASQGEPPPLGTSDLYRGLSELYLEWNDLEAAREHLLNAEQLGEQASTTDWLYRLHVTQARLKESEGDLDGALELLEEAAGHYVGSPLPDIRPLAALRARVWIAQGRLVEALAWARERGLPVEDNLSYLLEFEHITLARLLIAQYRSGGMNEAIGKATTLLARLLEAAEDGKRTGSAIGILVLQALAHQALGDLPAAIASLERALARAEPQGYRRLFVDEGEPMAILLQRALEKEIAPAYVRQLLGVFAKAESGSGSAQPLMEPLSDRELEVLRLLETELTGPEIARELTVSLNTMRTHTKSIYSKLGVHNRRAAVLRAQELNLL